MELNRICSDYFPFGIDSSKEAIYKQWDTYYSKWKNNGVKDEEIYSRYIFLENALISLTSHEPESLPIDSADIDKLTHFFTSSSFTYGDEDYFFHLIPDVKKRKISKTHLESISKIILNEKDNIHKNRALAAYLNFFPMITYFEQPKNKFYIDNFKIIAEGLYLKKKPEMFRPFFDILKSDGIVNVIRVLNHTTPDIDWKRTINRSGHQVLLLEHLTGNLLRMGLYEKYCELKTSLKIAPYTFDEEKIYIKSILASLKNEDDLTREIQRVHPKSLVFNLKESYFNTSLADIQIKNGNWRTINKFQDTYTLDELLTSGTSQHKSSQLNTIKALDKVLSKVEGGIHRGGLKRFVDLLFKHQTLSLPNLLNSISTFGANNGNSLNVNTINHVWNLIGDEKKILTKPLSPFLKDKLLGTALIREQFNKMTPLEWGERNSAGIPLFNFILNLAFHSFDKQFNFAYLYDEDTLIIDSFSKNDQFFKIPISGLSQLDILEEREFIFHIQTKLEKMLNMWKANETSSFKPVKSHASAIETLDFVQSLIVNMPFSKELSEDYVATQKVLNETFDFVENSQYAFLSFNKKDIKESFKEASENFINKGVIFEQKILKQIVNSTLHKTKVNKF